MEERRKIDIPIPLLVLDIIGAILVGLGLAEWFAATNLVPEPLRFDGYYIAMVVVGGLLMFPLLFHVLRAASGNRQRELQGR
ncbi:MAG: chemotaxis protein [Pseudomonadota bacterium]